MVSRLIPAHAGKTRWAELHRGPPAAHPRSRGENGQLLKRLFRAEGSSPLTRGKQAHHHGRQAERRLIPAHAGKTTSCASVRASCAAHPRSRGENSGSSSRVSTNVGSSPLTRGKLRPRGLGWSALGLIPAHAGKTTYEGSVTFPRAAHPRSRGENALCCAGVGEYPGSSPLTRGKHVQESRGLAPSRLIPAHAGKTGSLLRCAGRDSAHPRSRGENERVQNCHRPFTGSSPLTRGKRLVCAACASVERLIPAHAGKTNPCREDAGPRPAHPRSRGENPFPSTK